MPESLDNLSINLDTDVENPPIRFAMQDETMAGDYSQPWNFPQEFLIGRFVSNKIPESLDSCWNRRDVLQFKTSMRNRRKEEAYIENQTSKTALGFLFKSQPVWSSWGFCFSQGLWVVWRTCRWLIPPPTPSGCAGSQPRGTSGLTTSSTSRPLEVQSVWCVHCQDQLLT